MSEGADAWKWDINANWIRDNIEEGRKLNVFYKEDLINLIVPINPIQRLQSAAGNARRPIRRNADVDAVLFQSNNFRGTQLNTVT